MKSPLILPTAFVALVLSSTFLVGQGASDQEKARDHAKAIQDVVQAGEIAASPAGFSLKAKVDGKEWVATRMMSPLDTGRIHGLKGEESISLPFHRSHLVAGKTITLSENRAANLMLDDDVGIWGGRSGEITYTKVDATAAEGTFSFVATARDTTKTVKVTEGTFRILLTRQ